MTPEHRTDPEALLAHADWMRALAFSLLHDPAAADDVVQDATIAALLHAPADDHSLAPWLSRVVRNFAFRRRRSEARRAEHEAQSPLHAPTPSPADTLERLDLQRTLVDAVSAIEEPLRTTLVLRYFEGQSCAEIARAQRIPAGTVRWRLKRALEELRTRLDARTGSRESWIALMMPFAQHPIAQNPNTATPHAAPPGGGAAMTSSKLLTGVLVMKAAQLATALIALAIVGGIAWWGFRRTGEQGEVGAGATLPPPATAHATPDPHADSGGTTEQPAEAAAARASIAANPPEPAHSDVRASKLNERTATVDAHFVDAHGHAWTGVQFAARRLPLFSSWNPGDGVVSNADGKATLRLELPEDPPEVSRSGDIHIELVASHVGCGTMRLSTTLRAGDTAHLGDVLLGPGVRLEGRAIDENGNGVALATIGVAPAELPEDQDRMRRYGCDAFSEVPGARSSTDGTFVLEGVSPGSTRIWAHTEGTRYSWSTPIEVPSDRDVLGVEIALTALLATDRIAGRVVGPNDEPIAHAQIVLAERSRGSGTMTSIRADAEGRFGLLVQHEDSSYDFTARDHEQKFAATTVNGVRPGALDLVIRMHDKRFLTLHVRDDEGHPIADARFKITDKNHMSNEKATTAAPGDYSIGIPDGTFRLTVTAHGFRTKDLGKLEATALASTFDVVLQRAPVVRGRVIANGAPVAGARVHLWRDDADARYTVAGYRCRYMVQYHELPIRSDAEGRFQLDCDEEGSFLLRADAEGWAPGEVGPRDSEQLGAEKDIEIELTKGGAIEGHVILPDCRDAEGSVIALNHGDGLPRTLRAGPKGFFHIDGLSPGKWQVLSAEKEIDPDRTMYSSVKHTDPIEWSCDVNAGRTTQYDLDLSKR